MTAIVLHLSDIHIKNNLDPILSRAEDIAICLYKSLPEASAVIVLISGDIAQSGKCEQYDLAKQFFGKIKSTIQTEKSIPVHFVVAPGNHDCDLDRDHNIRQLAIRSLVEGSISVDDSVVDQCTVVQEPFFQFRQQLESDIKPMGDKLWETLSIELEGKTIVFDALNLSWVSRRHEEQGGIVFPHELYTYKENDTANVRIIVMHHPLNWLNHGMHRNFRQFIRSLASIVITGHEHQPNVGENIDTESSLSAYIEGDVLQDSRGIESSAFNVITLNLSDETYQSTHFAWKGKRYESTEEGSWSDYRKLPPKLHSEFEIQGEFRQALEDPGANFQLPGRPKISLSDIYIYPDLLEAGNDKRPGNFVSSQILRDPEKTLGGVLLEGEEKVGCTSLLYRLYEEYHDRGFVPLYITGANIKHSSPKEIDALIQKAVIEQYGQKAVSSFEQLSIDRKLLLLDDFDDCPAQSMEDRTQALCCLRKRFGHLILTVGMLFEARELLQEMQASAIVDFAHYKIQPFGYALRHKLTQKWLRLGNDGTISEEKMIAKLDQAEKAMDTVMGRNIIPSMPLYLLTLLQSIDAGRSGDFKDSALGHYYDYLLKESFLAARVPKEKINEIYDYCTELAWFFHSKKSPSRELSMDALAEFNHQFSNDYHTVDFKDRLEKLIASKVLIVRGGEHFSFRYPYIYYFLKGEYLSRNLSDIQIREYVEKCSKHLYVRENANTVLFLAHHTTDSFILDTILEALQQLFNQNEAIKFQNDTAKVAALITDAAKLKYTATPPDKFRERVNEARDEFDDGEDGLAEKEEDGDVLSFVAQLTSLFKTVEILGQILKNQYSSIHRSRKMEILDKLFSGPLRALAGFYDLMASNPDLLVAEIDNALKNHHKLDDELERRRIAKGIVSRFVQFTSVGFVFKASSSVSAESLHEDIKATVKNNPTLAYKLIELGVILDSSRALPRDFMLRLKEEAEKEVIASSLINILVIRHLYMFKTSEQDKQWLTSKMGINLGMLHAVDFKSAKNKRLNS